MELILKTKVRFLNIVNVQYFLLSVDSSSFTIHEFSRKEACAYIEKYNLSKVHSTSDGCIYALPGTKEILSECSFINIIYKKLNEV